MNEKSQKDRNRQPVQKADTLDIFKNKDIEIHIRNGDVLIGRLEMVRQYDIVVTIDELPVVIFKHGVNYIKLADSETKK